MTIDQFTYSLGSIHIIIFNKPNLSSDGCYHLVGSTVTDDQPLDVTKFPLPQLAFIGLIEALIPKGGIMKKVILACAMVSMAPVLGGCATVLNGTSQPVEFQSDPSGATIRLVNGQTCQTPCEYSMRRGHDSMVTFTLEGFQPVEVYIQSRTGGSVFGNVLAGGIIGGVVDASNGASNHLYPDPVYVRLVAVGSSDQPVLLDKDGELISTVAEYNSRVAEDVTQGMRAQGQLPTEQTPN